MKLICFPILKRLSTVFLLPLTALSIGCIDTVQILPLRKERAIRRIIRFIMLQYSLPHLCLEQITRTLKGSKTHQLFFSTSYITCAWMESGCLLYYSHVYLYNYICMSTSIRGFTCRLKAKGIQDCVQTQVSSRNSD